MKRLSALVISLGILAAACGSNDTNDATDGSGGTAGTSGNAGDSKECVAFHEAPSLVAGCQFVLQNCPATLEQFLTGVTESGFFRGYSVVEAEGIIEVRNNAGFAGHAYSFDQTGALAGWEAWNDVPYGPCGQPGYEQGSILGHVVSTPADVHRCDLAPDALETGELCDCPCPDPPPEDGIHDGGNACLTFGVWPHCAATFAEQRESATTFNAPLRSGCGVRTITLEGLDCAYGDDGALLGGVRHRGDDLRNECPGVSTGRARRPLSVRTKPPATSEWPRQPVAPPALRTDETTRQVRAANLR